MGSKKCLHFSEQITLFNCIKIRFAIFNTFYIGAGGYLNLKNGGN